MSDLLLASYILLWFVVVATTVVTLGTARQVALLTRRFPLNQVVRESGPELDGVVPPIAATTLTGDNLVLAAPFARRAAFIFVEDGCATCEKIRPHLEETVGDAPDADIWFIYDRAPSAQNAFRRLDGRVVVAPKTFQDWKIETVPFACVVAEDGRLTAKGELQGIGRLREELGLSRERETEGDET